MLEKIKKNKNPIIIVMLIIILSVITIKILLKQQLLIDGLGYQIFVENLRTPNMSKFMKMITKLSDTPTIVLITIILLILIKNKKTAITIPINISIAVILNQVLKEIFQRARPIGYRLIKISGHSFPSGHAMASTAFYGFLIYLTHKYIKNKQLKIILIIINTIIIIGVGISRIYLGVHYPSDVLAGQIISILYLLLYTKFLKTKEILT